MAEAAAPPSTHPEQDVSINAGLSHRQILTILVGLMLGMFLAALDQTIVASSIRTIADDLHGLSAQAWVTTAYLITSTIVTPLYGKLSDMYGRKRFFLLAISLFTFGSLLCSFSTSIGMLAAFRAVQGLGAGGLFTLSLAIIGDIVPPRERAKYQGYFLAVFGTSSVLGPVVGGFFAGADTILGFTGWRWVFLVNVPIAIIALVVVQATLKLKHVRREHRVDYWGALALSVTLVPLLIVAEQGRTWGWSSARAIAMFVIGGVGAIAFYLIERAMKDEALIPLRLFTNRTIAVSSIGSIFIGIGMFGGLAALPLYLQIVRGATPTEAGLQLLPLTGGIMLGSILSGQLISRTGRYRRFPIIGALLLTAAMFAFHFVGADTEIWKTMIVMVFFGVGLGFNFQPLTLAVQNAVGPRDIGVATSSATFTRQIGGTIGTAVFLSILFSTAGDNIKTAYAAASGSQAFQQASQNATGATASFLQQMKAASSGGGSLGDSLSDTSFLKTLDPTIAHPFLVGFSTSMELVFLVATFILAAAFVTVLFLPHVELRGGPAKAPAQPESAATQDEQPQLAAVAAGQGTTPAATAEVGAGSNGSNGSAAGNGHHGYDVLSDDPQRQPEHELVRVGAGAFDPVDFADQAGLGLAPEPAGGGRHEASTDELEALVAEPGIADADRAPGRHRAAPGEQLY